MRIECPECSQRFDVTDEFMGKTVECGSCDNRFKVSDDVLVQEKEKFYPGEKRGAHLERFTGSAASAASSAARKSVDFKTAHYQSDVDVSSVGPPRPRRTMAAMIGVSLMVIVIVIFLLAGGKEGTMRDMETGNRFVLAGFSAVLGCALVFYGMRQNRLAGLLLCLLLGGGLLAMPVLFPGNPISASGVDTVYAPESSEANKDIDVEDLTHDYLSEIGYAPVVEALEKNPRESVVAVYIRHAPQLVRDKIVEYLYEETGKLSRGIAYNNRGLGDLNMDGLIVMVKQKMGIDEIAILCNQFGRVNKVYRDLRVIDVTLKKTKMLKLSDQALDPESPGYYRQQLMALKSFDPEIKMDAVKRLGVSEPKALRDDISKVLIKILPLSKPELQLEIINTLQVWSVPGDTAGVAVLKVAQKLHQEGEVNKTTMEFLIDRKVDGAEVILMDLWKSDPVEWSDLLLELGEGAQVLLLPHLQEMDTEHVVATADILAKVGSSSCISHLERVMVNEKGASKKSLQAAIDEIKKRL